MLALFHSRKKGLIAEWLSVPTGMGSTTATRRSAAATHASRYAHTSYAIEDTTLQARWLVYTVSGAGWALAKELPTREAAEMWMLNLG